VPVPLDWRHPGGQTITLSVLRHLASHPERRIGSLFLAPSGPGDSGVAEIATRGEAFDALTQGRFDIIGWDIRGSGGSAPVRCFADASERASFWQDLPVPTTRAEERRYLAKTIQLAQRCGERNGELLAHIATADTARDLDYLRRLVGDRKLTVFGESFGTLIGQTYANSQRPAGCAAAGQRGPAGPRRLRPPHPAGPQHLRHPGHRPLSGRPRYPATRDRLPLRPPPLRPRLPASSLTGVGTMAHRLAGRKLRQGAAAGLLGLLRSARPREARPRRQTFTPGRPPAAAPDGRTP